MGQLATHPAISHAEAAVAAQRIISYGGYLGFMFDPPLAQELAELLLAAFQAFVASVRRPRTQTSDTTDPDRQ